MQPARCGVLAVTCCAIALGSDCGPPPPPSDFVGFWQTAAALPEPLQELQGAVLGDHIYVAGGFDTTNSASARAYRFSDSTQRWSRIADLPAPRHHMPLVTVGDSLYAVGGYGPGGFVGVTTLWLYDAATNQWLVRTSLPQARGASIAANANGRIILAGGLAGPGVPVESTDVYDPGTNTWSRRKPMITPRDHLGGGAVGSALGLWVITAGGRLAGPLATTEGYNVAQDGWATMAPMPVSRGGVGSAVEDESPGYLHVLGGEDAIAHATHLVYHPHPDNEWLSLPPMPTARHGLAVAFLNGRLYAIGGGPRPGFSQTAVVEVYEPNRAIH